MKRRIAHYELLDQLGEGGMGIVYKARDTKLERFVALKFLPASVQADPAQLRHLISEARIAAGLNHPNICTIYELGDVSSDETLAFIAMEYLEGRTLRECLSEGKLPLPKVTSCAEQIASGLQAAHGSGIIHRDIKPENIFVTDTGTVKILDFGLAHAMQHTATERGRISGSGIYMSPEQYRAEELDVRTDIWSFGAVLYEMLTGTAPFQGRYAQSLLYSILNEEPKPIEDSRRDAPQELTELCRTCLNKQRENRPVGMEHVVEVLEGLKAHRVRIPGDKPRVPSMRWLLPVVIILLGVMSWFIYDRLERGKGSGSEQICIAILPLDDLTGMDSVRSWSPLYQMMFENRLNENLRLSVSDPMSLNSLIGSGSTSSKEFMEQVDERGIDYIVRGSVVRTGPRFRLNLQLVDVDSWTLRFPMSRSFSDMETLGNALDSLSSDIAGYFEFEESPAGQKQDIRAWLPSKSQNIRAVQAFLNAYQKIYEGIPGARVYLTEAVRLDSTFIAPRIWLAAGLWNMGESVEARVHESILRGLIPQATPFERAMIEYVTAFMKGDLAKQRDHLKSALVFKPINNIVRVNLAQVMYKLKDYEGAEHVLEPAIRNRWTFFAAHEFHARCQAKQRKYAEASRTLEQAMDLNPSDAEATILLSGLYRRLGRLKEAEQKEERFGRLMQEQAVSAAGIQMRIATMLRELYFDSLAIQRYERILKKDPRHVEAIVALAETRESTGDLGRALSGFREALRLDPGRFHLRRRIGDILVKRSQYAEARQEYELFLKHDATSPAADSVRMKLRSLGA